MKRTLSRRAALRLSAAMGISTSVLTSRIAKANALGTRFGAIRWDSWYDPTAFSPGFYSQAELSQPDYQARAPFFATRTSTGVMSINGNLQATMDAEIAYAKNAGIKFWAYDWYGSSPSQSLGNGWRLHQSSTTKNDVNWCLYPAYAQFVADITAGTGAYVGYFQQANYEKYGIRPLLILFRDTAVIGTVTTAITTLRAACVTAGIGDPYIVISDFTPALASADRVTTGANAITNYARAYSAQGINIPFATLSSSCQAFWVTQAATGSEVIPNVTTGWNQAPIISRPFPGYSSNQHGFIGLNQVVLAATPAELATLASACLTWMAANPASVPANKALIYAWNEFSEGGYICPTYSAGGPVNTRLTALSPVIS